MRERKNEDVTEENVPSGAAEAPRSPGGQGDTLPLGESSRVDPAAPASSTLPPHADLGATVDTGEAAGFSQPAPETPGPASPPANAPPSPPPADPRLTLSLAPGEEGESVFSLAGADSGDARLECGRP